MQNEYRIRKSIVQLHTLRGWTINANFRPMRFVADRATHPSRLSSEPWHHRITSRRAKLPTPENVSRGSSLAPARKELDTIFHPAQIAQLLGTSDGTQTLIRHVLEVSVPISRQLFGAECKP